MKPAVILRTLPPLALALLLGSCSATRWEDSPPASGGTPANGALPGNAQPVSGELPRSKRGNPPFYEVYGVRYTILPTSSGYREQGVASWYGKKFHGRDTSSGERYNMYAMTAAHKTLPLPTNVRVTNLENGKSIIVRVNDRGPFVKNRLIDLSYAAADELGVIAKGTALVEVVALNGSPVARSAAAPLQAATAAPAGNQNNVSLYLQVGAFGEQSNAQNLVNRLVSNGISNARVHSTAGEVPRLYRVRIGPLPNVAEYDRMAQKVEALQIAQTQLVVESAG